MVICCNLLLLDEITLINGLKVIMQVFLMSHLISSSPKPAPGFDDCQYITFIETMWEGPDLPEPFIGPTAWPGLRVVHAPDRITI